MIVAGCKPTITITITYGNANEERPTKFEYDATAGTAVTNVCNTGDRDVLGSTGQGHADAAYRYPTSGATNYAKGCPNF